MKNLFSNSFCILLLNDNPNNKKLIINNGTFEYIDHDILNTRVLYSFINPSIKNKETNIYIK